jgi:hypothetical protein
VTSHGLLRFVFLLSVTGAAFAAACGQTTAPLGGPYGGNGFRLAPTDGGFLNIDATYTAPTPPPAPGGGPPGTFAHIFSTYLATGTVGNCTKCHAQMSTAAKSFKWLTDEGCLDQNTSCLSWYGGDMPPGTPPAAADAKAEMDTWVAAGSRNN